MRPNRLAPLALAAVLGLSLAACGSDSGGTPAASGSTGAGTAAPVTIAAAGFSESKLIANMYQQVLEKAGQPASIKELTTREVIEPALEQGEVQVVPEYLGSLTEFLNKAANGPDAPQVASADVAATFAAAKGLAAPRGITLLEPSAAQDQNAFAVTRDFSATNKVTTLSELGTFSQGSPISLGGPPECPKRPFCQPGLEKVYDVQVGQFVPLDAGGPLTVQALNQGKVQVGLVFSSSGAVTANNLVVLADDKGWQTAENILPAVSTKAVTPQLTAALDSVSKALTTEELQALNQRIEIDREDPAKVAASFLQSKGLA